MSRRSDGIASFVAGTLLGVGVGMLFAPKSGEELRKDLRDKINELIEKAKEVDIKEVSEDIKRRVTELKKEIEELDKEKVLAIAKEKGEELKKKANDLFLLAKDKGTPVVEKAAAEVRERAILVTKEMLKKLEKETPKTVKEK